MPKKSLQIKEIYFKKNFDLDSSFFELGNKIIKPNIGLFYSPTDFLAHGSFPFVTSPDPFDLQNDRVGNFLFNYEKFRESDKFSFTYVPKLINPAIMKEINYHSLNLPTTNTINKLLFAYSNNLGNYGYANTFLYHDEISNMKYGVNGSFFLGGRNIIFYDAILVNYNEFYLNDFNQYKRDSYRIKSTIGSTRTLDNGATVLIEYSYNPYAFSKSSWLKFANPSLDEKIKLTIITEILNNDLPSENIISAIIKKINCFNFFSDCNYLLRYDLVSDGYMARVNFSKIFKSSEVNIGFLVPFGGSQNIFSKIYSKYAVSLKMTHYF